MSWNRAMGRSGWVRSFIVVRVEMSSIFEQLKTRIIAGKYRLDDVIGRGGFSAVYRGEHLAMSRAVAIKVLMPRKVMGIEDDTSTQRFSREAKVISQLQSPHTITVFDYGAEDGLFYLVMEYIDGSSLKEWIKHRQERFAPERAVRLAIQMLSSLEEAHHYGVLHRDLKPANIMLARDYKGQEVVKVVDFGIAKVVQDAQQSGSAEPGLTQANSFVGTPRYAAPEQLFAQRLSAATDVYGVGLILWEMLAGKPALSMSSWHDCSTFHMENRKRPMRIPASVGVPERLAAIVERAIMRHVPQRFQTAAEMREALEAWAADPDVARDAGDTSVLMPGIPKSGTDDSGFRLPQAAAPSAVYAPSGGEDIPSLGALEEDSLVFVRDKQVLDPNLSSAEFYFGADQDASAQFEGDPASSSQIRARRLPDRVSHVSNMPASYANVELEEDLAPSTPSYRNRHQGFETVSGADPASSASSSSLGSTEHRASEQPRTSSSTPNLVKPLIALMVIGVLAVGGAVIAQRVMGDVDEADESTEEVAERAETSEPEVKKEAVATKSAHKYSTNGIMLAIKSAGWKKGRASDVTDLTSFTQQTINFYQGDTLKCEATLIEARSAQIIKDLASVVKPPHRFIIFDTKAVKLTPRNSESRQAVRELEATLERYRGIVDEGEGNQ